MRRINQRKAKWWVLGGVAVMSAAAGSLTTAWILHDRNPMSDSGRVFELNIYHVARGKAPAVQERFRDASNLLEKHGLNVLGYWIPYDDPVWDDTFIYLVAHRNRSKARQNWQAFHDDPQFQKYVKAEDAEQLIRSVDTVYMRPSDYSKLK